ncbi:TIGR02678 family protein [Micromonospora sp. DR5-3]|uniref:TIGR02678 family protein n=1 Tax=unclassified Micromonospora TaxID=2617518 RepID=UPI0011D8BE8A|nr:MULTISPECIES: TIGR02678 family protein [unclassified Micromonospora]MCW3820735.1 TIGR02678 family protein [Micromonospora sp. DR5-3]TYC17210.1 TIGR02678 family protein [Micromonospora sp. MP36]
MSDLRSELDRERATEQAQAIRALLARPLLTRDTDAGFALVVRHRANLVSWFDTHTGWRLIVEPRAGYARLMKTSPRPPVDRPARRPRGARTPFDRRRYTLLCLVAAELLGGPVTTIGIIAERLAHACAAEPGIVGFDSSRHDDRRAYVDALLLLEELGVLTAVDGSTDAYLQQTDAKVLYRVDSGRLVRLLAARQAPSRLPDGDIDALLQEPRYAGADDPAAEVSDEQRNRWLRHSIVRRLLDDPVVYFADLSDAQRAYAHSITGRRMLRAAVADAGMVLEERAEGLLAVDPDAFATDEKFPAGGSVAGQAALLLLDTVLAARPDPVGEEQLIRQLADRFAAVPGWARTYRSDGGPQRLTGEALALLTRFGLIQRDGGAVRALPAAARYAVSQPTVVTPAQRSRR